MQTQLSHYATPATYKSLLVLSFQNLSQKDLLFLILSTEVDSVLGRVGGWWSACCGGGDDVIRSSEGLEQLPSAALDSEPLCEGGPGGGEHGVEGVLVAGASLSSRLTERAARH